MTRIAVMQPYFIPYAGYFRLFAVVDTFVFLDTVQFPRRGWVHRNRLVDNTGQLSWLTLPLKKGPREILIKDLEFPPDAPGRLNSQFGRFPVLRKPGVDDHALFGLLNNLEGSPVDYIERLLQECCSELALLFSVTRASELGGLEGLRREELIMAIASQLGATEYVNLPGGRALYDEEEFRARGMSLRFLDGYDGPSESILGRILTESPESIRKEILENV